ncbi:MAG: hypothetical protein NTZ21_08940 [Actinobacteria bacterium]|nr:hypothetical protein [Actinomycetota bacterium]
MHREVRDGGNVVSVERVRRPLRLNGMADHMRTELVIDAHNGAITARGGDIAGVIAHADR